MRATRSVYDWQRPISGVLAGMPLANRAFHAAFTAPMLAPGTYTSKSPPELVDQNASDPEVHVLAATSCAFVPPPNTTSPKPLAGSGNPMLVPLEGGTVGVEVAAGGGVVPPAPYVKPFASDALSPPGFVTVTVAGPDAPAGVVAYTCESPTTHTFEAFTPPTVTIAPDTNREPSITSTVPPDAAPVLGVTRAIEKPLTPS